MIGRPRAWHVVAVVLLVCIVVAVVVLPKRGHHAAATTTLELSPVGPVDATVKGAGQLHVDGSAVKLSVESVSGGEVRVVAGPRTGRRALQFPPYVASGTYPRAAVRLTPASKRTLSPGDADFEYGAVFRLDATSSGRVEDNGDNLLQRGLYADPAQFKLQLDHGYASCVVRGKSGQAVAKVGTQVRPDAWYTATCSRVGDEVRLRLSRYGSDETPEVALARGSTGALRFSTLDRASIGGKLTEAGELVTSATDQFNGAVASVWFRLRRP